MTKLDKNMLVSVVLLAEQSSKENVEVTIRNVIEQTWQNTEIIIAALKTANYSELEKRYSTVDKNIQWLYIDNSLELLDTALENVRGELIFYKSVNPIRWYQRHIQHHIELLEHSKRRMKWSYSFLEIKGADQPEPLNNIGWRIEFPKEDQVLLDELVHTSDIKIDWKSCIQRDANNAYLIPGLALKQLRKYIFSNPEEITVTLYTPTQPQQPQILGTPQSDNTDEEVVDVDGELAIAFYRPTVVGNSQFVVRNSKILSDIDNDSVKTIAVKRSMGLGDVILVEPITRALKDRYKNASITLFTTEYMNSSKIAELFEAVDEVKIIDSSQLVYDYLSKEKYNLKFDLDLAYESRLGKRYIDSYLEVCGFDEQIIEQDGELILSKPFTDSFLIPRLGKYKGIREVNEKYVTCALEGSGWGGKQYDIQNWFVLIDEILKHNYKVVFTSNVFSDMILNRYKDNNNIIINSNNSFSLLLNFIEFSSAHLGADNGPMHIATVFNIPTFIVSGAALVQYTTPANVYSVTNDELNCLGCKHRFFYAVNNNSITFVPECTNQDKFACMNKLNINIVFDGFKKFATKYNLISYEEK
jgi:ADP-heptose:LPS heptosyltransferase